MEEDHKELQLLPTPHNSTSSSPIPPWPLDSSIKLRSTAADSLDHGPPLDLQLSISLKPIRPLSGCTDIVKPEPNCVEALKWHTAEQIRLAAMEKAYAERVKELSRQEMELAQLEFARARHVWETAREEFEKAERMKERAINRIDSTCMEITCQSCRQKFRP